MNNKNPSQVRLALVSLLAVIALLAACSSEEIKPPENQASADKTAPSAPPAAPQAVPIPVLAP